MPLSHTGLHRLHGERGASSKFGSEVRRKTLTSVGFWPRTRPFSRTERMTWLLKAVFLGLGCSHPSPCAHKASSVSFFPVFKVEHRTWAPGRGCFQPEHRAAGRPCMHSVCSTAEALQLPGRPWSSPRQPPASAAPPGAAGRSRWPRKTWRLRLREAG